MADRHTFLYQDIAEPASLEVPSSASWQPEHSQPRGDSWAKKWSIAALTAVSLAYVGEPITPPEDVTVDKWYQQLSTPRVPPKPGLHASLQQFGNQEPFFALPGDATELLSYPPLNEPRTPPKPGLHASQQQWGGPDRLPALPGDATSLQTYQQVDLLPVTDGPITLQGEYAYAGPVAISDVRWLTPFSEPVLAKLRFNYPQEARVEVVEAGAETITIDKWYQPFGVPGEPEGMLVVGDFAFLSAEVTNISWHVALSEPTPPKPGLHAAYQQFTVDDPDLLTQNEAVHVQWAPPLSLPVLPKPHVAYQQAFVDDPELLTQPEAVHVQWAPALEIPANAKPRAVEFPQPAFVEDVVPETITLDKWFQPLSEPYLVKVAVAYQQASAFQGEPSDFVEPTPTTVKRRRRGIYRRLGAYN